MQPLTVADLSLVLAMGLASSLHCTTMCGPLVAVACAPAAEACRAGRGAHRVLLRWQACYHLGRAVSYSAVGALIGGFGTVLTALFARSRAGAVLQVGIGIAIALLGVGYGWVRRRPQASSESAATRLVRRLVTSGSGAGLLALGLGSGLLPCGVLYAAFARALVVQSPWEGAAVMFVFWLGTVPLLGGVGLASVHMFRAAGRIAPVALLVATVATGGWLAYKGVRGISRPPHPSPDAACHSQRLGRLGPTRMQPPRIDVRWGGSDG